MSGPSSPSNLSSVTLVGSTGSGGQEKTDDTPTDNNNAPQFKYGRAPSSPLPERIRRSSFHRDTLKEEDVEQPGGAAAAASTTSTSAPAMGTMSTMTTTQITHPPPPLVMTTPCVSNSGHGEGRMRGGSLKVDPQITINLSKPTNAAGGGGGQSSQTLSISPPQVTLDRRPSVGANVIPQAALCQHRHSLQFNGDGGIYRVRMPRLSLGKCLDNPLVFAFFGGSSCPCSCEERTLQSPDDPSGGAENAREAEEKLVRLWKSPTGTAQVNSWTTVATLAGHWGWTRTKLI